MGRSILSLRPNSFLSRVTWPVALLVSGYVPKVNFQLQHSYQFDDVVFV